MNHFFVLVIMALLTTSNILAQHLNLAKTESDSISFPLNIGNKFFYQGGRDPDDGFYGATKEIMDSLTDGTRVILVTNFYVTSTFNATEYWLFNDKKLFAGSSYPMTTPVFNGDFDKDTCTSALPSICYEIFDSTIFNQYNSNQGFLEGYFNPSGGTTRKTFTANKIGVYFKSYNSFSFVPPFNEIKDSITLIGFTNSGILIGDSILTNISDLNPLIDKYELKQNYPNPFNPSTTIKYEIPEINFVTIKVFDLLGREVATLDNEEKPAGSYEVQFKGSGLTSGIYFYQLKAGEYSETKKMILLK